MNEDKSELEKQQERRDAWNDDFKRHSRVLQNIPEPLDRWSYICSNKVKTVAMCDSLMMHCAKIGLVVEKHKLDWTEFHKAMSGIGKGGCTTEGCRLTALPGQSVCVVCRRNEAEEARREEKRRKRAEALVDSRK
jgi:hypothetical protein